VDSAESPLRGKRIGLSYESNTNLFCRDLVEGIREAAAAHGATVLARVYENSIARQMADMQAMVDEGVDVLIISAVDSEAVGPAVVEARARDVPVFSVDRAVYHAPIVSHVTSDNLLGGRLAANFLANALGSGGDVAIVGFQGEGAREGEWAATSIADRIHGFKAALPAHQALSLRAEASGGDNREHARQVTQRLLQTYPQLAGIFATNDVMVQGVLDAVRECGRAESLVVVGYDATPQGCAEIMRGGPLRGEIAQFPRHIGHKVIELWANYVQGMRVPERLDIPVELVTLQNVQSFTGAERLLQVRRGEVWTAGERVVFFPVRGYQLMLNEIHAASPDLLRHIVYRSGFVLGERIAAQVNEIYPDPHDCLFVLMEDLARGGFGRFELVELDLDLGQATIRGHNLFEATLAPELDWVRTPRCVDTYCSGRLAGYLTAIVQQPTDCEEICCEARGDPYCEFALTAAVHAPPPWRKGDMP
jgi:ABC-type sugar transport system substrate-binding protein